MANVTLDMFEYANDTNCQNAYVSNGGGLTNEITTNPSFETWTGGDNVAPDSWTLYGGAVAKESTTIKVGTYSAKLTTSAGGSEMANAFDSTRGIAYWKGKTVTLGMWVWCATADIAHIHIYDGISYPASSLHTGNSTWQWLTVTLTVSASATQLSAWCAMGSSSISAYFDGAICVEGNAIGTGELVYLQSYSEATIKTQGSYSLKAIASTSSLNKTLTRTIGGLDQSISEAGQNDFSYLRYTGGSTKLGSVFTAGISGNLNQNKFFLKKVGSPTGNIFATLYATSGGAPTGSAIATSNNVDVSTLTTSYGLITFTFSTPYWVTKGTSYCIVVEGDFTVSVANYVVAGQDTSFSNGYYWVSSWTNGYTYCFYTYIATIDLSSQTKWKFDMRASRTGSNVKVGIHDSGGTTTETTPNITSADTFQTVEVDISGVADADKNNIDWIKFTQVNADSATTYYVDNMFAEIPALGGGLFFGINF